MPTEWTKSEGGLYLPSEASAPPACKRCGRLVSGERASRSEGEEVDAQRAAESFASCACRMMRVDGGWLHLD